MILTLRYILMTILLFNGSAFAISEDAYTKYLAKTKKQYRLKEISDRVAWQKLSKLYNAAKKSKFDDSKLSELLQSQAFLLERSGYPLLASRYASIAIAGASEPYSEALTPSWEVLDRVSSKLQIHDILTALAEKLIDKEAVPPMFGKNWYYFLGEANLRKPDVDKAIAYFEKVDMKDRYYMASRFQLGMTYLTQKDDQNKAGLILKSMVSPDIKEVLSIKDATRQSYIDQAHLALGRIQYEREKFISSAKYYRKVRRTSSLYYNALFEQSWSFFLAGYPNHALGSLHAVDSPYFGGRFNPEVSILRSIIYYWMCRYDDSKTALAGFLEDYADPVNNLETWLSQKNLSPEKAYQLFENLISGVSEQSLGMNRQLLESVAKTAPMVFARERLATVATESERLKSRGVFRSLKETAVPDKILGEWITSLTAELGRVYIGELEALRDDYKNLRSQANFIYIELLMSEKEQILGKELHKEEKISKVNLKNKAKGWGDGDMPWKASDKGEYWWDEVGFFVYQVKPKCNAQ